MLLRLELADESYAHWGSCSYADSESVAVSWAQDFALLSSCTEADALVHLGKGIAGCVPLTPAYKYK